jgi:hypothetical protein
LNEARRKVSRLGQQKEANLRDVGPGRDVNKVVLPLRIEGVDPREVMKRAEDFVEIPGIADFKFVRSSLCFRRDASNIVASTLNKFGISSLMEKLEAIDQ